MKNAKLPMCSAVVVAACAIMLISAGCGQNTAAQAPPKDVGEFDNYCERIETAGGKLAIELDFSGKEFVDADLDKLSLSENVTSLNLAGTQITDAGLERLLSSPNIERIDLRNTKITDAALDTLKKLPNLKFANVHQSGMTRKGQLELMKFLAARQKAAESGKR